MQSPPRIKIKVLRPASPAKVALLKTFAPPAPDIYPEVCTNDGCGHVLATPVLCVGTSKPEDIGRYYQRVRLRSTTVDFSAYIIYI